MGKRFTSLNGDLYDYLTSVSVREPEVLKRLREETAALPLAMMQVSPDQGQFMGLLVKLIGAHKVLEVGVFTGYSALSMALALPLGGRIEAFDISEEWTLTAKRYWREAGVSNRIHLRLGPALSGLDALLEKGEAGTFDLAFIDADKINYESYFERGLQLIRGGGIILIDNVFWGGRVADPAADDEDTSAIRAFNKILFTDERVEISMLPIGDGLTLARKIP